MRVEYARGQAAVRLLAAITTSIRLQYIHLANSSCMSNMKFSVRGDRTWKPRVETETCKQPELFTTLYAFNSPSEYTS